MIVTIDGPAASGKSTVARLLAERIGFAFLNTGAMYRAIAVKCLDRQLSPDDAAAVAAAAQQAVITFPDGVVHLDGVDISGRLATDPVAAASSRVAVNPAVRDVLMDLQRRMADRRDVVTEGRDQGTIVFPHAELKFFLTASAEVRAMRRHSELVARGEILTLEEIVRQIRERDLRDANRPIAPLRPAADAIQIDSSQLTILEAVDHLESIVRERQQVIAAE